jgi:hypothetical protein
MSRILQALLGIMSQSDPDPFEDVDADALPPPGDEADIFANAAPEAGAADSRQAPATPEEPPWVVPEIIYLFMTVGEKSPPPKPSPDDSWDLPTTTALVPVRTR